MNNPRNCKWFIAHKPGQQYVYPTDCQGERSVNYSEFSEYSQSIIVWYQIFRLGFEFWMALRFWYLRTMRSRFSVLLTLVNQFVTILDSFHQFSFWMSTDFVEITCGFRMYAVYLSLGLFLIFSCLKQII